MRTKTCDVSRFRCDLCIYGGSRGERILLSGGTWFHVSSTLNVVAVVFVCAARLLSSSATAIVLYASLEEGFARWGGIPFVIAVDVVKSQGGHSFGLFA